MYKPHRLSHIRMSIIPNSRFIHSYINALNKRGDSKMKRKREIENVGLSNTNIGKNPMHRKPKCSSARFVHEGWLRAQDQVKKHSRWTTGEYLPLVGPEGRPSNNFQLICKEYSSGAFYRYPGVLCKHEIWEHFDTQSNLPCW